MHKCPNCGHEFEERAFAAPIIESSMQIGTRLFKWPPEGDMVPVFEDGRWWNDWSAYNAHMRAKEAEANAD